MKPCCAYPCKLFSGIIMLAALVWLTVGTSLVYLNLQKQATKVSSTQYERDTNDYAAHPFNNTEEQNETCSNVFPAEYLQQEFEGLLYSSIPLKRINSHYKDAFANFHSESFSPPPELV